MCTGAVGLGVVSWLVGGGEGERWCGRVWDVRFSNHIIAFSCSFLNLVGAGFVFFPVARLSADVVLDADDDGRGVQSCVALPDHAFHSREFACLLLNAHIDGDEGYLRAWTQRTFTALTATRIEGGLGAKIS